MVRDEQLTLCFEQKSDADDVTISVDTSVAPEQIADQHRSATIIALRSSKKSEAPQVDNGNARLLEKIARRAMLF